MSNSSTKQRRANQSPVMRELPQPARNVVDLNSGWRFHRCDQTLSHHQNGDGELPRNSDDWELVSLPHAARLEPAGASGGRNFQGVCWYARELELPELWRDRVVYLHFEGAMQVADVWLNEQKIASHYCGYTPFAVDISRFVDRSSRNSLLVRLDNSDNPQVPPGKPQSQLDFTYFGGLYRNVR